MFSTRTITTTVCVWPRMASKDKTRSVPYEGGIIEPVEKGSMHPLPTPYSNRTPFPVAGTSIYHHSCGLKGCSGLKVCSLRRLWMLSFSLHHPSDLSVYLNILSAHPLGTSLPVEVALPSLQV